MKINKLIVLLLSCLLLISCNKRPKMAYDQKDKGAIQDIESFNVEKSAENFRNESGQFKKSASKIINENSKTNLGSRRITLETLNTETNKRLSIIDHNFPIKKLENVMALIVD